MKRKLQLADTGRTLLIIVRPMGVSGIDQAFGWTYMTYSRLSDHVVLCRTVVPCHCVIFFFFCVRLSLFGGPRPPHFATGLSGGRCLLNIVLWIRW